ncbi:Hsp20/alpha crystallin family protein [Streptomyces sp. NPDC001978]|uniref:Hsp20/alpha crystallin family protein n=1 Tax=Streptomyces sp. NPDC001978 TaxID=3364627 RepID=UPI0036C9893B
MTPPLPGIKHEDIDVEISDRELCITGEYKERKIAVMLGSRGGTGHGFRRGEQPTEPSSGEK